MSEYWQRKWDLWNAAEVPQLREVFRREGIKGVLFDLDDTLTKLRFHDAILIYARALERASGKPIADESLMSQWYQRFKQKKLAVGISPRVNAQIAAEMAEYFGADFADACVQEGFTEMWKEMYETVPENIAGSFEAVQLIKAAGADVGVVTHGEYDWTWLFKLTNWRGEFKRVECVDVFGPKGPAQWAAAIEKMELTPREVMVVGDNVEADILPAREIGVKWLFRVASNKGKVAALPEGVHEVEDLREIIKIMIS